MQTKRETSQQEMTLLGPLEQLIPDDYPLKRLNRVLDLSFVHEAVRDRYCQSNGRASIDPEVVLRIFLLQAITGISSVRQLMREIGLHIGYRWFLGYRLEEALPDHSTLSKALERFGDDLFDELFARSIAACQQSGLIEGKLLHMDATTIRADINRQNVNQPSSSDPDARYGKFPGEHTAPGYKQHTIVDDDSRVILGITVTPADQQEHDQAVGLVDDALPYLSALPAAICGDASYASGRNYVEMQERGTRLVSPPPQAKTYTGDAYFSSIDFEYQVQEDQFVCPAGQVLKYYTTEKQRGRKIYRAQRQECQRCALKARCTRMRQRQLKVSVHHAGLVQLRADSQTESFRSHYRRRMPVIEGVFAEAKQWHGLRRAWRRGLPKMRIQCLLIATVINLKRLIASLSLIWDCIKPQQTPWRTLGDEFDLSRTLTKLWRLALSQQPKPRPALI